MNRWENVIKEKLEGYDSPLPNGSYAAFQKRREAASRPSLSPIVWVWVLSGAVAAAVGLFFLFRPSASMQDPIPIHKPVTVKAEPSPTPVPVDNLVLGKGGKTIMGKRTNDTNQSIDTDVATSRSDDNVTETQSDTPDKGPVQAEELPSRTTQEVSRPVSTDRTVPDDPVKTELGTSRFKDGLLPGSVLGLGALGTLTAALSNNALSGVGFPVILNDNSGGYSLHPQFVDAKHFLPLKLGASARIALSDRLYFTTGIDYILYRSQFSSAYDGTGGTYMQQIHYLGVPLRMDWMFFSGKRLEVYLGAGLEGNLCVSAQFDGKEITKNPAALSFLGATGVQLNVTRRLGIYLEPQLCYTLPLGTVYQKTYQTEHPFMFTVASGLRITIGK